MRIERIQIYRELVVMCSECRRRAASARAGRCPRALAARLIHLRSSQLQSALNAFDSPPHGEPASRDRRIDNLLPIRLCERKVYISTLMVIEQDARRLYLTTYFKESIRDDAKDFCT